jgi:tRNA A-37 threonylcarbamoyl transferase component Bud32
MIGKIINNSYEVQEEIARGGMATVYRAHQISMNRDVAIKILPPEFMHESTFLERFRQEAAIASHLEHRAIVPVYDYGEWEGMPYIAMRLMEGRSVDNLLEQGPVPLEQAQQIIRQVASALDYAHSQGVLHRDLKPSNILLDRNGDAYLTDFGIARLLTRSEKLTSTGVVGTPAYMSPEQAQGLELDGRSDVYALGVVLFEMLTGRRPFEADTPYGIAVMQVTKAPPSARTFNTKVPTGVEQVIYRALEKEPTRRFASAVQMAGALDDADLIELEQTAPHTPVPIYASPPDYQHPTPPHAMLPITGSSPGFSTAFPSGASQPIRRVSSPATYFGIALALAIIGSLLVLGLYLFLADPETVSSEPDFAATGSARLTATAITTQLPAASAPRLDGQIVYVSDEQELYLLDLASGNSTRLTETSGAEGQPSLSSDGNWLAYVYDPDGDLSNLSDSQIEVYIQHLDGSERQQITSNLLQELDPIWLPDGSGLIYAQQINGLQGFRLILHNLATGTEDNLYQVVGKYLIHPSLSPDGQSLIFAVGEPEDSTSWDLFRFDLETKEEFRLTENNIIDWAPVWHPTEPLIYFLRQEADEPPVIMSMAIDGNGQTQVRQESGIRGRLSLSANGLLILAGGENALYGFASDGTDIYHLSSTAGVDPVWIP